MFFSRTQQSSSILENLVHEHFEGLRCVDCYEIIENKRLGKGSYGSVYLCKHRKTGDEFACKIMGMNRINSHYLRKLHSEIAIMKVVDHPNIIKLREVFFGSRTVYLVMERCHGGELFDEITVNGQDGLPVFVYKYVYLYIYVYIYGAVCHGGEQNYLMK